MSANSLQVTAQFSKLRISVRVGTCGAAGAWPEFVWGPNCSRELSPEGTAGVTCPVVGNRGALAGGGFCVACARRTPSAGTAGSVQNQNANTDNPIRNAHCFIPVLLPQFRAACRNGSAVGWAKPTGPACGRPDDRLRVPTKSRGPGWRGAQERALAQP